MHSKTFIICCINTTNNCHHSGLMPTVRYWCLLVILHVKQIFKFCIELLYPRQQSSEGMFLTCLPIHQSLLVITTPQQLLSRILRYLVLSKTTKWSLKFHGSYASLKLSFQKYITEASFHCNTSLIIKLNFMKLGM